MSRVTVAADALNTLIAALEGLARYAGLIKAVQSTVKKASEHPEEVKKAAVTVAEGVASDALASLVDRVEGQLKLPVDEVIPTKKK